MKKIRVLFLCIHNSARSQMGEAYLKFFGGETYEVESAGLEAGKLNPFAVKAMLMDGIDISTNKTNDVNNYHQEGRSYNFVISVCDEANAARCPIFPGVNKKSSWSFPDPSSFSGTDEEKLQFTINVRDKIKEAVKKFIRETSV